MSKSDGGPAFPSLIYDGLVSVAPNGTVTGVPSGHCLGMSLRDYFAGQAIEGLAAEKTAPEQSLETVCKAMATVAYMLADAMLAERSK